MKLGNEVNKKPTHKISKIRTMIAYHVWRTAVLRLDRAKGKDFSKEQ